MERKTIPVAGGQYFHSERFFPFFGNFCKEKGNNYKLDGIKRDFQRNWNENSALKIRKWRCQSMRGPITQKSFAVYAGLCKV